MILLVSRALCAESAGFIPIEKNAFALDICTVEYNIYPPCL